MAKGLALGACVLLWVAMCAAQDSKGRPDFGGSWTRDRSKSDFGRLRDSPDAKRDVTLLVSYEEPTLKLTRRTSFEGREERQELVYYTDGRGETNPSTLGRVGLKSQTKWDGKKIVSRSTLTRRAPDGGTLELNSIEKWELSADGRTLTQTSTINAPYGTQTVKQVYTRAP